MAVWTQAQADAAEKKLRPLIDKAERDNGLQTGLLLALIRKESMFNTRAYNSKVGASGLMQIVKTAHPSVRDPFNPNESIPYGAKYLRKMKDKFGSWPEALIAYNWGPTNVWRFRAGTKKLPVETQNYIAKVMMWMSQDPRNRKQTMIAYL